MSIDTLRSRLEAIEPEMRELADLDELSPAQQARWDELSTEFEELEPQLKRAEAVRRMARAAEDPANLTHGAGCRQDLDRDPLADPRDVHGLPRLAAPWSGSLRRSPFDSREGHLRDVYSRAFSAIERVAGMRDGDRERATRRLEAGLERGDAGLAAAVVATTDPNYVSAFARYMRDERDLWSAEELAAVRRVRDLQRAMSLGVDTAGGFLVPESLDPALILDDAGEVNPVRQHARSATISTRSHKFITSTAVSASYDGEAAEVSDDSPTLGEVEVTAHKAQAFVPYSIELGLTSNLTGQLATLFVDAKELLEADRFVLGSGTDQPFGYITRLAGSASEVASNTTDVFGLDDVYDLEEELPPRYRRVPSRVRWAANKRTYQAVREAGGQNLDDFWVAMTDEQPARLLGYSLFEASPMDGTIEATQENRVLVLANWREFFGIVDRIGLQVEAVPHLFGTNSRPTGQRGAYAYWMSGSDRIILDAARLLNVT